MRVGSLFSGVGALDLAVEAVVGGTVAWHVEADPHAAKVLAVRFPGVPNLGDITTVDWTQVEPVDVLCGGFPCTDISNAGLRAGIVGDVVIPAGKMGCGCQWANHDRGVCEAASPSGLVPSRLTNDPFLQARAIAELNKLDRSDPAGPPPKRTIKGTRSGLWTYFATAIRTLRPEIVLLENVAAILARGLDVVAADLAAAGYDARWTCLRASDVGAPHRRDRWFAAAHPAGGGGPDRPNVDGGAGALGGPLPRAGGGAGAGDPPPRIPILGRGARRQPQTAAHPAGGGRRRRTDRQRDRRDPPERSETSGHAGHRGAPPSAADPEDDGRERVGPPRRRRPGPADGDSGVAWGPFEPAIRRWEHLTGVAAPPPTDSQGRLSPDFVEWMMGVSVGWTDVGLSRSARLRCLGNAVVPLQAATAYRHLLTDPEQAAA